MNDWHLDQELADRYSSGRVTAVLAASVEQHLVACGDCRGRVHAEPARLDTVWAEVLDRVEAPRIGIVERGLRAAGLGELTARLVAATPALRAGWVLAVLVVLVMAWLAGHSSPRGTALFVVLAPTLPLAGVALSFGQRTDPTLEIAAASPYSLLRLLAARTLFVVATTIVPATALALFLPGDQRLTVGWLLPALAMCAVVLAAAHRVEPHRSAVALAGLWAAVATWRYTVGTPLLVDHVVAVQSVSVAVLAVAAVHILTHSHDLAPLRRTA